MKVEYYHERPGAYTGNIIWSPAKPMRNGKFPSDHPAAPGGKFMRDEIGEGKMGEFRALGYWASCFPEGDGITMKCERGQNTAQVVDDIKSVFGWDVTIKRGDRY